MTKEKKFAATVNKQKPQPIDIDHALITASQHAVVCAQSILMDSHPGDLSNDEIQRKTRDLLTNVENYAERIVFQTVIDEKKGRLRV